jgi:hypothetical protein
MELAAAGENLKKLREIARAHIEKAAAGDMQAIKDLADRLDGRPAQVLEHSGPDSEPIRRIVREIVHVTQTPEEIAAEGEEPLLIEWRAVRDGNGSAPPLELCWVLRRVASSLTTITVITRSRFLSTVISVTGRYLGGHTRSHFRFFGTFKGLFRV